MKFIANYPVPGTGAGGAAIKGSGTYTQNSGTIQFSNSNGVTFGLSNNGVMTASVAAAGGTQTGISGLSAGTTQMTSGTAVFSNSNGISFGVNGNTVTASYNSTQFQSTGNYLTTAALSQDSSKYAGINGAITGGSITFNTSGVSINLPAYLTTAMASNAGSNFVGVTTVSGTNVSGTFASNGISLSANAAGGGGVAFSASASSMSSGTITFSNSNGVFFGLSNGVLTASASTAPAGSLFFGSSNGVTFGTSVAGASTTVTASIGAGAGAAIKGSGTYTQNSATIEFANSNGITFGLSNNGTMTASHNGITTQTVQPVAISGSNGSFSFSTVSFGNLNGASFYTSNGSVVASYTVPSTAGHLSAINVSGGTTSNNLSAITFSNSNGVSFGLNGSVITATVATNYQSQGAYLTTARASNDAIGLNSAFTAGPLAMTINSSGLSLNAASAAGTTSGFAGNLISGSMTHNTAGLNMSLNHPAWLTTAMQSNAATISNINVSGGTTSSNLSGLNFVNSNGVSWSLDTASKIYATVKTDYQTSGAYLTTAMASNRGSDFLNVSGGFSGTNISGTLASNGLQLSVAPGGGGADGYNILAAGTQTANTTGTILFSNANGITFGMSNSSIITASYNSTQFQSTGNYLTTAAQSNQVVNSLNGSTGQISLNVGSSLSASTNGSSVTFGLASNITTALQSAGAYLTTAMQSNAATISNINISGGTTSSNLSAFNFVNSNGVSWSLDTGSKVYATVKTDYQSSNPNYLTSQSNQAFSASGGSTTFQTLNFANSNGITFSNSNGSVIASHNGLTTARASTDAIGLNTAQSNVTWTVNSSGLSLDARGYVGTATGFTGTNVSATMTHNSAGFSLQLSAGAGGGAGVAVSAGGSNFTSGTVSFGNTNGASFITTNGSVALSFSTAPAGSLFFGSSNNATFGTSTAGASTTVTVSAPVNFSAGTTSGNLTGIVFSNSNGVSFGINGGTVTASAAGAGGGGIAISASNSAFTSGTVSFNNSGALTIGTGAQAINFSVPATSSIVGVGNVSISTAGSTISISGAGFQQRWEQIPLFRFSLSNLTNITAISNVPFFQPFKFYGDMTLSRINWEMSRSTSGSNAFTVTAGIYGYSNETAISLIGSATGSFSNTATASVSGIRRFGIGGFNVSTFTAGGYVIGMQFDAGANTASMNYSIRGHSGAAQVGALLPGADSYNTATNYNVFPFLGRYSTTVAFPTSVADSAVRGQFSGVSVPINAWIGFNND